MATQLTKSQLIEKIASETEIAKKDIKGILETLASIGYKELKKSGVFLLPGFAKFVVIKKPATKARKGTNPFTRRADDLQGQAGPQDCPRKAGQGCQGRGLRLLGKTRRSCRRVFSNGRSSGFPGHPPAKSGGVWLARARVLPLGAELSARLPSLELLMMRCNNT